MHRRTGCASSPFFGAIRYVRDSQKHTGKVSPPCLFCSSPEYLESTSMISSDVKPFVSMMVFPVGVREYVYAL